MLIKFTPAVRELPRSIAMGFIRGGYAEEVEEKPEVKEEVKEEVKQPEAEKKEPEKKEDKPASKRTTRSVGPPSRRGPK